MHTWRAIAAERVVEDVSAGLGASIDDKLLGTFGDYTILFLEPEQLITAGGGVAVLGRGRKEKQALASQAGALPAASRLTDVNSALGLTQLRSLQSFVDRRNRIVEHYMRSLGRSRHSPLPHRGTGTSVPYAFAILVDSNPKEAVDYARKKHVELSHAFAGSILNAFMKQSELSEGFEGQDVGIDLNALPNAERLVRRCLTVPLFPMLTGEQIETVGRVIATLP